MSRQYASIIFVHDSEQEKQARASKEREESRRGATIHTEIVALERFTLAEDYHQKYYLQSSGEFSTEFSALYPDPLDFVNSTAAARVNGYVGGNGSAAQLETEIDRLGLSEGARESLRDIVSR
jgi:peptide-methionine (S)-S-oxide reductase